MVPGELVERHGAGEAGEKQNEPPACHARARRCSRCEQAVDARKQAFQLPGSGSDHDGCDLTGNDRDSSNARGLAPALPVPVP